MHLHALFCFYSSVKNISCKFKVLSQKDKLHCKFKRVVLTPRGNFRPFCKRVVSTLRKGRFNSEGSYDPIKGSKLLFMASHDSS